ncbi:MAG TPA: type II toxin-antitoxin system HicA family toxin [Verrucomicrobiota bacterium]|nr:type II toxin-antitoxin system HicA family toxin [Verrucomicrobiota bacterium]
MKLPRDLAGRELAKQLCKHWDYIQVNQEGSHIILQTESPSRQRIPVPDHNPVRLGTLNSILRLIARHKGVEKEDVLSRFR